MAMDASEIERRIKAALPDAQIEIRDLAGDGDHYAARAPYVWIHAPEEHGIGKQIEIEREVRSEAQAKELQAPSLVRIRVAIQVLDEQHPDQGEQTGCQNGCEEPPFPQHHRIGQHAQDDRQRDDYNARPQCTERYAP